MPESPENNYHNPQSGRNWLIKDISDWAKVIGLAALIIMGYQAMKDQIAQHTEQLKSLDGKVDQLKIDSDAHYKELNKKMGKTNMYLCSKDSNYCKDADQ